MNSPIPPPAADLRNHREARWVGILLVAGSLIGLAGIVIRAALEGRRPGIAEPASETR